jgi:hypothetical protein
VQDHLYSCIVIIFILGADVDGPPQLPRPQHHLISTARLP